jgi:hypothetical protein
MANHPIAGAEDTTRVTTYFLVRVHVAAGAAPLELTGIVERIGLGEKRSFGSGEELLRLLSAWPGIRAKILAVPEADNG